MEIQVQAADVTTYAGDALVVNLFEGVSAPGGATGAVDRVLGGILSDLIVRRSITGKMGEHALVHTMGRLPVRSVLMVGLGKKETFSPEAVRTATAVALRALRAGGARQVGSIVHGGGSGGLDPAVAAQAVTEGALLGLYRFQRYKKGENGAGEIETLVLLEKERTHLSALAEGVRRGQIVAEATNLARDLVNEPANSLTPRVFAAKAQEVARALTLQCEILTEKEMKTHGMGALLGVAQGSAEPPRLIALTYRGALRATSPVLGLVGKGITFDSGGISIKPSEGMEAMKGDMAGGAAAVAAIKAIAELKLPVSVVAVIPVTENLPSGTAQRPGDIVRAMNGTTIEVINTDAEGRLILADALCYARKLGATHLVDIATLTGACVVALGAVRTGAFATDRDLLERVKRASEAAGEKIWELPLDEEYEEQIKSDFADIKNVGGRKAGAITAARFLTHFVDTTPWVHLDIAGTSDTDKEKGYSPKGATGVMVRTLVELARSFVDERKKRR